MKAIKKAIEILGSQAALAELLDVSPQFVNQMARGVRPVPVEVAVQIQRATDGQVTVRDLRPDLAKVFIPG